MNGDGYLQKQVMDGLGPQALLCQSFNQGIQSLLPSVVRKGFGLWFWLKSLKGMSAEGILGMSFFSLKKRHEIEAFLLCIQI